MKFRLSVDKDESGTRCDICGGTGGFHVLEVMIDGHTERLVGHHACLSDVVALAKAHRLFQDPQPDQSRRA